MRYHNITKADMLNGDGIRVVLWVAGCNHHCHGCQNPITWDPMGGIEFDDKAKQELFEALDKDYISGITFSGGDPLHPDNRDTVLQLIKDVRDKYNNSKTIWLYTGYQYEEISYLVCDCNVVVEGVFIESLADKQYYWAGSTNQRVIDVFKTLQEGKVVIYANN